MIEVTSGDKMIILVLYCFSLFYLTACSMVLFLQLWQLLSPGFFFTQSVVHECYEWACGPVVGLSSGMLTLVSYLFNGIFP